ncbi:MAG: sigma-70 family RNA polymerase sigma factor [Alicyclobacillus sp.]|nr:sigma-70 family RNA polymerase sigma factor [Alicyclobacillus sp.]
MHMREHQVEDYPSERAPQHPLQAYQQWNRIKQETLVQEHLPLVYKTVRQIAGAVSLGTLEIGDLVNAGVLGLYTALERFDDAKGIPFGAFAQRHVRGRILDEIARHRQIPRGLRDKQRMLNMAYDTLSQRLLRDPTDKELAEELQITVDDLHQWWSDLGWTSAFSLEALESAGAGDIPDDPARDPFHQLDADAARDLLARALKRLTLREQQVLWAYYQEDCTLKEIGEILDLSESQVSRIRSKAIMRLRSMLEQYKHDLL